MSTERSLPPLKGPNLALLTFALSLGIFMNVLDVSIANVAIPTIAGNLAVSPDDGTWVITSFAVSQAIMLPLTGWLARRFGEVRLFIISTISFTIISVLCGLSTSLNMLLFFRTLQGAVSGPMIPLSQSLLLSNYPHTQKGLATGLWAMAVVVAPIVGPVLGGWITDNYTWPWIFYINVPVGIISVILAAITLRGRESKIYKLPIDVVGLVLLTIGIGCLQVLLDKGHDSDWFNSNFIIILTVISVISLIFLLVWELTDENPIVDLTLFANRNFTISTFSIMLGFMVYFSNVVIFPLWLQTQMGYTPTWAGLAAAPVGILPFFLTPFVGRYMNNFDLRLLVSLGFIIFALTSFMQSNFYTQVGYIQLVKPRFIQGLGLAFFFSPLIAIGVSELPEHRLTNAFGLANFLRILGGSFGTSLSVTIWNRRQAFHNSRLVENINDFNPVATDAINKLHAIGFDGLRSYGVLADTISNQAFMLATNDIFWLSGWIFTLLLFVIWLAKPRARQHTLLISE